MAELSDYAYISTEEENGYTPARILSVHRERYGIVSSHGEGYARLKAGMYFSGRETVYPTTGDFVLTEYNPSGDSMIVKTLKRRTFFSRRDSASGHGDQAVAANFDYVFIMQSMNANFNPARLERYAALAWQSGAEPVVVLTKSDLTDDVQSYVNAAGRTCIGVSVHPISVVTGDGLSALDRYFQPKKAVVFLGSSGIGKSSLVNLLAGREVMDVNGIRESDARGRHTTTHRELIMLDSGAMVIDTPGMRELGLTEAAEGISDTFYDVEQFFSQCRYSNCTHGNEPGCAVRAAIESGALSKTRYESYRKLKRESDFAAKRSDNLKKKNEHFKNIAKLNKSNRKK